MNEYYQFNHAPQTTSSALPPVVAITGPQTESPSPNSSSASTYANLNYLFGVQDIKMLAPKAGRNRRKSAEPGHIKHRRTRSGCYTCRSRRVKCDEGRPTCERCKKGSRECVYPEPTTSSKSSESKLSQPHAHDTQESSSGDDDGDGDYEALETILDEDESRAEGVSGDRIAAQSRVRRGSSQPSSTQRSYGRTGSETPSLVQDKGPSPTPSTEGSIGYSTYQSMGRSQTLSKHLSTPRVTNLNYEWTHLPRDVQFYLEYFNENITYLHYSLKYDPGNFLKTDLLEVALRTDSLLYAVVGFSAFQRTLHNPRGKIEDFLPYYNKAVSLLLASLKNGQRHEMGILLSILQLATIEEFLGDWVNLLGHQKAAFEILTELYTPTTIMQSQTTRIIISWYQRFDVFAGLLGGFQTVLSREWFTYGIEFLKEQTIREPERLSWRIEHCLWQYRLLAMDMSLLFARLGKGEIPPEQFAVDNQTLSNEIAQWENHMDPALQDPRYLVTDFSGSPPPDPGTIIDPYIPGILYNGPLYVMNIARLDWMAIDLLHRYQTSQIMGVQPSSELTTKAYASCQLYEAIELMPESPPETVLCLQASLGIACLFLPRDEKHAMWGRRKLATIESHGYIYPYTFRSKMADLFRDRSCMHWWLPNNEHYPTIVRSIRRFVEERTKPAKDVPTTDLAEMKAIFSSLNLDDDSGAAGKGKDKAQQDDWPESNTGSGRDPQIGGDNDFATQFEYSREF